jgi:arsenate reductase
MKVYGITNCNTVKKALNWLRDNRIEYEFHDFKKLGVTEAKLKEWAAHAGWEALINKKGTTWRNLDPRIQASVTSEQSAFALMQEKTSVIRRPVIEHKMDILFGFDEDNYRNHLLK